MRDFFRKKMESQRKGIVVAKRKNNQAPVANFLAEWNVLGDNPMLLSEADARFTRRLSWCYLLLFSLGSLIAIISLAPYMTLLKRGTSADFWGVACWVDLDPSQQVRGSAVFINDYWVGYTGGLKGYLYIHGMPSYYVPMAEVEADFPTVIQKLDEAAKNGDDTAIIRGFKKWQSKKTESQLPISGFLKTIQDEQQAEWEKNHPLAPSWRESEETWFFLLWQRSHWYWANIFFEWGFITGLAWLAVLPYRKNLAPLWWGFVTSVLPLLFMLPVFLGYSTLSFSSAEPDGGILYPYLLPMIGSGSRTETDELMLLYLPQVMEPLSFPVGSNMKSARMGMPGPTRFLTVGLWPALFVIALRSAWVLWRRKIYPSQLRPLEWLGFLTGWPRFAPEPRHFTATPPRRSRRVRR
jgi:hypothetical protein